MKEEPIKWKVVSSQSYRWGKHKIMKPGQIFLAFEKDIPEDFMSMIMKVEEAPTPVKRTRAAKPAPQVEEIQSSYYWIKERVDGTFDIFSRTGK